MNQQKRTAALLAIILIPMISLAIVFSYSMYPGGPGEYGTPGACFDVTVIIEYGRDYGKGTNQTFAGLNFPQGATAFQALLVNSSVDYQYTGSLVLVTAINGVHNNASANLFWQYYVNGVFGPVASNLYHLGNNSMVEWRYQSSQF
jgi:hypothetical protein